MNESEKSYKRAFDEIESFMEVLYDEADPDQREVGASVDEIAPMYQALTQIEKRYENLELIGKGAMKAIYRAHDSRSARYVAMAMPVEKLTKDCYDAFLREAHLTARLEHPSIVNLYDMGIDESGCPFFTMELKKGRSLRETLRALKKGEEAEEFSLRKRLIVFMRICEALEYAHSRRVLHLDLKPENIQIGAFGEVQVCDWGMGVVVPVGDGSLEESELLLDPDLYGPLLMSANGTPEYMAPEQRNPKTPKTTQMDIHALGCMLQELVTLELPNQPLSEDEVADVPLQAMIAKARDEVPEKRYTSVEELRKDLFRYLGGFSTSVEQAGFLREARLFYLRHRLPCRITIFFTVLLLCVGAWFTQQLRTEYLKTEYALNQTRVALDTAEEALARYQRERVLAGVLLDRQIESVISGSYLLLDDLMMDKSISLAAIENAIEEIDEVLSRNPPSDNVLWSQKAYTLFLTQRFSEAGEYYGINDSDQEDLRSLVPEFENLVADDELLPVDDFIRLLERLANSDRNRDPLIEKMSIYDSLKRNSIGEISSIVRVMIGIFNTEWDGSVFAYETDRRHLSLGGIGLDSLIRPDSTFIYVPTPRLCLLRLLDVQSLDIRSRDFTDLSHLNGLNLRRLDIRGTSVVDLSPIASTPTLRQLVVEPNQYSGEELALLPDFVDVLEIALND